MSANPLKEYTRLRDVILARKAEIEAELRELAMEIEREPVPSGIQGGTTPASAKPRRRRNSMSLGNAVFSVTKDAPLSKEGILTALERMGFRFPEKVSGREAVTSLLQIDPRFEESNGRYGPTLEALFPAA